MPLPDLSRIRNIGIMAHIDAGKTTLSERMLFYCQKIHKLGEVHDGAATMDFMPEEQERGITITSACTTCAWQNCFINLVDTPGHVDFTMEVERCLRVLDGAVGVFCGVAGVEPQSETVWRQSESFQVPKLAFINKMDREGADFAGALTSMRERLGANPVAINIPNGSGSEFSAVLDLIDNQKITFDPATEGRDMVKTAFTPEEEALAAPWREKMLEALADADDEFMAKWLDENWNSADVHAALKRATISRAITPVLAGAALRNCGVQPLLDAVCAYLPAPDDLPPAPATDAKGKVVEISPTPQGSPVALVFKIAIEGSRKNAFLRLYQGTLKEGQLLANARTGKTDRISRLTRLHADRREQIAELGPGDIAAVTGLRDAMTGDTYTLKGHEVALEPIRTYAPVITIALEPLNADEGKILDEALARYAEEDPTLKFSVDEDSGLRMLSGMGELHLEVTMERLGREYRIEPRQGQPQVVMRETILDQGSAKINFDRELGKERHQGEVELSVQPLERGAGNIISDFLPDNPQEARKIMPQALRDAVRESVANALATGVASGWPLTDIAVRITGINRTEGLTTQAGLAMAAGLALREAIAQANPVTLEPIMAVEITTPEDYLGAVINLLTQSSGKIEDIADHAGLKLVTGSAPMRQMFGFSTRLRSATQGRAGFTLSFKCFNMA